MTQQTIACPHCGASNVAVAAFCEACGKALPSMTASGPRIVSADALPQTAVGHRMVSDELLKTQKKAKGALLAVAIIATIGALLVVGVVMARPEVNKMPGMEMLPILAVVQVCVAGLFWGLWYWARKSPLPAAITGLVAYSTLVLLNVINALSQQANSPDAPRSGFGGIGVGLLDIIIIVVLIQAIGAGLKHKKLLRSMEMA